MEIWIHDNDALVQGIRRKFISYSCELYFVFATYFHSSYFNKYKHEIASVLTKAHRKGHGTWQADLCYVVWGGNRARGRRQRLF
jgi:hypothetical protein